MHTIRGEAIHVFNSVQQAEDVRDALGKALYSRTFDWLVSRVNQSMRVGPGGPGGGEQKVGGGGGGEGPIVGVLDIFGFEIFENNRLVSLRLSLMVKAYRALYVHVGGCSHHPLLYHPVVCARYMVKIPIA